MMATELGWLRAGAGHLRLTGKLLWCLPVTALSQRTEGDPVFPWDQIQSPCFLSDPQTKGPGEEAAKARL